MFLNEVNKGRDWFDNVRDNITSQDNFSPSDLGKLLDTADLCEDILENDSMWSNVEMPKYRKRPDIREMDAYCTVKSALTYYAWIMKPCS